MKRYVILLHLYGQNGVLLQYIYIVLYSTVQFIYQEVYDIITSRDFH